MTRLKPAAILALHYLMNRPTCVTERSVARALGTKHAIALLLDLRDLGLVTCANRAWSITTAGIEALRTGSVK